MKLLRPQPFQIIWRREDGARRQVTTFSEREARALCERKRRAGFEPAIYIGNLEIA